MRNSKIKGSLSPDRKRKKVSVSYKTFEMVSKILQNGSTTKKFFERYGEKAENMQFRESLNRSSSKDIVQKMSPYPNS